MQNKQNVTIMTKEEMGDYIETMNTFGSRETGAKGHRDFIVWLRETIEEMGFMTYSKTYTFPRWELEKSALMIEQDRISIASVYPYSKETNKEGITGKLILCKRGSYKAAKGNIAVVEISNRRSIPYALIMNQKSSYPRENRLAKGDGDLVLTSVLKNPNLKKAKEQGALAMILIWKGVSDEKVQDQYLPFTDDSMGIPAIWVNETNGKKVLKAAKEGKKATLTVDAFWEKEAKTDSFYVKVDGTQDEKETILINTHTDGVNVVEENGAIGLIALLSHYKEQKPNRTLIFIFVTGHFRLSVFKGTSQATSTWMMDHPHLWDGKEGHLNAVAGLTLEHMGSMEWKETKNKKTKYREYKATGLIQTEYTYTGNPAMERILIAAVKEREHTRTVTLRGHNHFLFGESQPLFEAKIPMIGFVPMPEYLMANSKNREMDKFNLDLMYEQTNMFLHILKEIDTTSTKELGKADSYSYIFGRNA